MDRQQATALGTAIGQQHVLPVVVRQHQIRHVLGHGGKQLVALLHREIAVLHDPVEQDLDVHLMVAGVHPGGVVDGVGVQANAVLRGLDPAELGQAEIAALADHFAAQLGTGDTDGIVGLVPHLGIGLGGGPHVCSDATVPQQIHRCLQDRVQEVVGGHALDGVLDSQGLADLLADRHGLQRSGIDPAPGTDQLLVVVLPARPGQLEQALTLLESHGRVRSRVQEDVPVVEGCDQTDVLGQQHPVPEHIAAHVADTDDCEVLALGVDTHFEEVALHRLPCTTGGDPHRLVVVADGPPGGERITEPEAVLHGLRIRDVRERCGPLVGGDDQIGVVTVPAEQIRGRHHRTVYQVVREVQQAADEGLVTVDPLGHERLAVGRRRRVLHDETTLRAHGDDHRVLHHLRLDQTEHLGAEVLPTVTPPQPAPGHPAEPQVHAGHTGRGHEDLEARAWQWHARHLAWIDLEGQPLFGGAVHPLVVVGAEHGEHDPQQLPDDAVVIQGGDRIERGQDLLMDALGLPLVVGRRVVPGFEQVDQQLHDLRVGDQDLDHVLRGERRSDLPRVLHPRPHRGHLAPVQPTGGDQSVEQVRVGVHRPAGEEGVAEPLGERVLVRHLLVRQAQAEIVDVPLDAVGTDDPVGTLVEHLHPEAVEDRDHGGQRDLWAGTVDREPSVAQRGDDCRLCQRDRDPRLPERVQAHDVGDGFARGGVLLVGLRERPLEGRQQLARPLLSDAGQQRRGELVVPGPDGIGEFTLEDVLVDLGDRRPRRHVHHDVQAGQDGFAEQRGVIHRHPTVGAFQGFLDALAHLCVVTIPR